MANGFYRNAAACQEIDAGRRGVRHFGNNFEQAGKFSAIAPRLFRNT
jgi:hypothetical protein